MDDLLPHFTEPEEARRRFDEVLGGGRTWRGEVSVVMADGTVRPLQVRADPVSSGPGRVLGFVFLFTDLTERKAADAARRRFQEGIAEGRRVRARRLDTKADLMFKALLGSVVENAQLAALEITDGVDLAHMPELLESVRASVARTAAVLEVLIAHAARAAEEEAAPVPRPDPDAP